VEFLKKRLADGPAAARPVEEEADAELISERTLKRAKRKLGVVSEKIGEKWIWRLPVEDLA
jgi:hypothetical protein